MSLHEMAAVLRLGRSVRLTGNERLVLHSYAHHADDQWLAWPSYNTLSDETGLHRCTCIRIVHSLQEHRSDLFPDGILTLVRERERDDGSRSSNVYRVNLDHVWGLVAERNRVVAGCNHPLVAGCDHPVAPDATRVVAPGATSTEVSVENNTTTTGDADADLQSPIGPPDGSESAAPGGGGFLEGRQEKGERREGQEDRREPRGDRLKRLGVAAIAAVLERVPGDVIDTRCNVYEELLEDGETFGPGVLVDYLFDRIPELKRSRSRKKKPAVTHAPATHVPEILRWRCNECRREKQAGWAEMMLGGGDLCDCGGTFGVVRETSEVQA